MQLQCRLFAEVEAGLDFVLECVAAFDADWPDDERRAQRYQRIKFVTQHLDMVFGEVHVDYLRAYLSMP